MSIWGRKKRRDKGKKKGLSRKIQGIIIISPWLLVVFNALMILLFYLILPKNMEIARWGMMFIIMLMLNGWFLAGVLVTYIFRDQSMKFVCPTFSAPLGEDEGFVTSVPPIIRDGKIIEPEYTIRAVGGFEALWVYSKGKVLVAYPSRYEVQLGKGGIGCYCWLRERSVDQVAKNVRDALVLQGAAHGYFLDATTEIWFGRTVYDVGEAIPNQENIHYDVLMDEREQEINRLKGIVGEKDYQVESYELSRSREAFLNRPAEEDFRDRNTPPDSVRERSLRSRDDEEDVEERRRRRRQF